MRSSPGNCVPKRKLKGEERGGEGGEDHLQDVRQLAYSVARGEGGPRDGPAVGGHDALQAPASHNSRRSRLDQNEFEHWHPFGISLAPWHDTFMNCAALKWQGPIGTLLDQSACKGTISS